MTRWLKRLAFAAAALTMGSAGALGQDIGASNSGNWEDSSIWQSIQR